MPRRSKPPLEFTGQDYGDRQAAADLNAAGGAGGAPGPAAGPEAMMAALENEDPTPVTPRTARPGEPMTSGLDVGAGPDSSILPPRAQAPSQPPRRIDVEMMAPQMPMLELLAAAPNASPETRAWFRQLRSQMPVDVHMRPAGGAGRAGG